MLFTGPANSVFITLLCVVANIAAAEPSWYTLTYLDGSNVTLDTHTPELPVKYSVEYCNHGVWIIYDGYNYTANSTDGVGFVTVVGRDAKCDCDFRPLLNVLSARPVGVTSNSSIPSVTFYTDIGVQGEDHLIQDGDPQIDYIIESVIVINASVELFNGYDYTGDSFCFVIVPRQCDKGVCVVFDFEYYELPWDISLVRSARIGCPETTLKRVMAKKTYPIFQL